jgi:hypothetical protein
MHRFITRLAVGIMAAGVSLGLIATSGPAASAATHTRATSAATLPAGETVTHYADGRTLYTIAMKFAPKAGRATGIRPDGFGQNPGDCGTAKLWTYAGSHQFQLSLIGNAGVFLGLGAYEFTTNGIGSLTDQHHRTRLGSSPGPARPSRAAAPCRRARPRECPPADLVGDGATAAVPSGR